MRTSYDPEADARFVHLADGPMCESQEVAPDIIFEFDESGRLVRIEVLNASQTLAPGALPATALEHFSASVNQVGIPVQPLSKLQLQRKGNSA